MDESVIFVDVGFEMVAVVRSAGFEAGIEAGTEATAAHAGDSMAAVNSSKRRSVGDTVLDMGS